MCLVTKASARKTPRVHDERKESVMDYKKAGVDIEAGYKSVELMKKYVQGTMRPEVLTNLGGFSGAFSLKKFMTMENPTPVSYTHLDVYKRQVWSKVVF